MLNSTEGAIRFTQERTLKDISVNAAALLCYVAGWISGIVFLVLEQKNRFVRFHALQSIIVFGTITIVAVIVDQIPWVGGALSAIVGTAAFILWIVLMVKAGTGEVFKLPWAGNLAEKLAFQSMPSSGGSGVTAAFAGAATGAASDLPAAAGYAPGAEAPASQAESSAPTSQARAAATSDAQARSESRRQAFRAKYYSPGPRTLRIVGSSFAIAFSLALLVFFNFFHQYIGYYQPEYAGGHTYWQISTFLTSDFNAWLPVINTALILGIIGHAAAIVYDKYLFREGVELILGVFGLASVISLLAIFPFDFSVIPNTEVADGIPIGLTVTLILVAVGFGIGILVRFIQVLVHAIQGEY